MTPYEEKLRQFCQDEVMYQAVRAALFARFDANDLPAGVSRSERESAVTAVFDGRDRLNAGFKDIEKFKHTPKAGTAQENPI